MAASFLFLSQFLEQWYVGRLSHCRWIVVSDRWTYGNCEKKNNEGRDARRPQGEAQPPGLRSLPTHLIGVWREEAIM
jgi:hypothetical protein